MIADYAHEILSRASGKNYIFPIFSRNLPTFLCFLPYFLGLPVPTFSLLFVGNPVEALNVPHMALPWIHGFSFSVMISTYYNYVLLIFICCLSTLEANKLFIIFYLFIFSLLGDST